MRVRRHFLMLHTICVITHNYVCNYKILLKPNTPLYLHNVYKVCKVEFLQGIYNKSIVLHLSKKFTETWRL